MFSFRYFLEILKSKQNKNPGKKVNSNRIIFFLLSGNVIERLFRSIRRASFTLRPLIKIDILLLN